MSKHLSNADLKVNLMHSNHYNSDYQRKQRLSNSQSSKVNGTNNIFESKKLCPLLAKE